MKAADTNKDQTFFLGQVSQESLRRTLFPLGYLHKWQVKELAMSFGLEAIASKKEVSSGQNDAYSVGFWLAN